MGRIAEGWRDYRDRSSIQTFAGADLEGLPEISDLLSGKANGVGTGWERPPLSLLIYLDGDGVKFCFSAQEFPMQLWGSCSTLKDGLLGIEESLCRGHCEWKKKKSSDNGFTSHRK